MGSGEPSRWEELARCIQQGNLTAEEELVRFFYRRVLVMATARLRDPEAARDIAQETLLAVLQALRNGKLREAARLPAFVLGTARNLVNNYLRAQSRRPNSVLLERAEATSATFPAAVEQEERSVVVRAAVQRLKPLERKILLLTLNEGMNPREIGPLVGLKPENVRTRKSRAVKSIIREIRRVSRK